MWGHQSANELRLLTDSRTPSTCGARVKPLEAGPCEPENRNEIAPRSSESWASLTEVRPHLEALGDTGSTDLDLNLHVVRIPALRKRQAAVCGIQHLDGPCPTARVHVTCVVQAAALRTVICRNCHLANRWLGFRRLWRSRMLRVAEKPARMWTRERSQNL